MQPRYLQARRISQIPLSLPNFRQQTPQANSRTVSRTVVLSNRAERSSRNLDNVESRLRDTSCFLWSKKFPQTRPSFAIGISPLKLAVWRILGTSTTAPCSPSSVTVMISVANFSFCFLNSEFSEMSPTAQRSASLFQLPYLASANSVAQNFPAIV